MEFPANKMHFPAMGGVYLTYCTYASLSGEAVAMRATRWLEMAGTWQLAGKQ